jgi:protein SCO1/2
VDLPLEDQAGRPVALAQFRGKVVFLVPFLTSCQEECPITTGALLAMRRSITHDGLTNKVAIVETTVDPWRDTPQRLTAYAGLTGGNWPLLTGSAGDIARLWQYFGIYYQTVPEGSPAGIDWETHRPYSYDVNHSNGFILLDRSLRERFFAGGMAKVDSLRPNLQHLLDNQGQQNLDHPESGSWTIGDGLDAIGWVLGRPVAQ